MRFNPKLAALAFATTAAFVSFGAQASSIEIKVTGTIIPTACTPTLAGGGTIDYGTFGSADVSQTDFTLLPEKNIAFSIVCNAPTKVALKAVDNRANTRVLGVVKKVGGSPTDFSNFGLGSAAGKNIGGYVMRVTADSFTADSASVKSTFSVDSGTTWGSSTFGTLTNDGSTILSWSATSGGAPVAFTSLSGNLFLQAVLNKGSDLALTSDVSLDGSATLELIYL
ncbi:DUF1120 domain-containing protein [Pseudomonas sp. 22526]|uniref:DUF1120 domain-containing protein n=1 Tax=Pseudomonas sp. 22526 TaxID=3453937 RepID=UPI003F84F314